MQNGFARVFVSGSSSTLSNTGSHAQVPTCHENLRTPAFDFRRVLLDKQRQAVLILNMYINFFGRSGNMSASSKTPLQRLYPSRMTSWKKCGLGFCLLQKKRDCCNKKATPPIIGGAVWVPVSGEGSHNREYHVSYVPQFRRSEQIYGPCRVHLRSVRAI